MFWGSGAFVGAQVGFPRVQSRLQKGSSVRLAFARICLWVLVSAVKEERVCVFFIYLLKCV